MFIALAQAATDLHATTESAGGIGALGLDGRALAWQIVNFALLLWLLQRFAYKPLLKLLEDRRQTIEESLKNAATLQRRQTELEAEAEQIKRTAQAEAQTILAASEERAHAILEEAQVKAAEHAQYTLRQAEATIEQATRQAKQDLQQEVVTLVALACEQILQRQLDSEADQKLIQEALAAVREKA